MSKTFDELCAVIVGRQTGRGHSGRDQDLPF